MVRREEKLVFVYIAMRWMGEVGLGGPGRDVRAWWW